jgi:competence ComEA-like helix-hairpin-helix protein
MPVWTPGERRGAVLVAVLLLLGAARDLWRATHPVVAPPPAGSPAPTGDGAGTPVAAPAAARPVELNRAGPAELDALPGIGPVLAGRIVRYRSEHGPFREPEDLLAVPGIGPRLLERLRPLVRTGPVPGRAAATPATTPGGVAIGNPVPRKRVQIPIQRGHAGGR